MSVPKYFNAEFNFKCERRDCETPTPIASDLMKLIFKLDNIPYISNLRRGHFFILVRSTIGWTTGGLINRSVCVEHHFNIIIAVGNLGLHNISCMNLIFFKNAINVLWFINVMDCFVWIFIGTYMHFIVIGVVITLNFNIFCMIF